MAGIYLWAVEAFARWRPRKARWIGLVAAALLPVSMYQIRGRGRSACTQWGRPWSRFRLGSCSRAFRARAAVGAWGAYTAAALAFAYTHYFALYSLVGQAAFAVGFPAVGSCAKVGKSLQEGRRDACTTSTGEGRRDACTTRGAWRRAVVAYAVVAIGSAPWLPTFLRQKAQVAGDFLVRALLAP